MNGGGRTLEIFTIPYYFCKVFPLQFSQQKAQKEEKCFWKKNLKLSKIFLYQKIFQITFHQNFSSVLFSKNSKFLTSIFRPSTMVPCNSSLALSASTPLANVTKPKPFDPLSLNMISTSNNVPYFWSKKENQLLLWQKLCSLSKKNQICHQKLLIVQPIRRRLLKITFRAFLFYDQRWKETTTTIFNIEVEVSK